MTEIEARKPICDFIWSLLEELGDKQIKEHDEALHELLHAFWTSARGVPVRGSTSFVDRYTD